MDEHRVAFITGIPTPYRDPAFQLLSERPGISLKVFYCSAGHADVAWTSHERTDSFDAEVLPNWTPSRFRRMPMFGYTNVAILKKLREFQPTYVIVHGHNQLTYWMVYRYCLKNNIPFGIRGDTNVHIDTSESWMSRVRRRYVPWLVKRCHAVLPLGTANRLYWEKYGAQSRQIHMAWEVVDNDRVAELAGPRRPSTDGAMRFLYVGRLIHRKGVDMLLEAFNRLAAESNCKLTIVGDGAERQALQAMQTAYAQAKTDWRGKLPNDEVFREYGKSDVFVLPSRYEPWGFVVNEAIASGMPVIADKKVGAAGDLVLNGETGFRLETLSEQSIYEAMKQCCDDPARVFEMGEQAALLSRFWTYDRMVSGIVNAIEASAEPRNPKSPAAKSRRDLMEQEFELAGQIAERPQARSA